MNSLIYAIKIVIGLAFSLFSMFLVLVVMTAVLTVYADWATEGQTSHDHGLPDVSGYSEFGGW